MEKWNCGRGRKKLKTARSQAQRDREAGVRSPPQATLETELGAIAPHPTSFDHVTRVKKVLRHRYSGFKI
jgi:hypothetical protein